MILLGKMYSLDMVLHFTKCHAYWCLTLLNQVLENVRVAYKARALANPKVQAAIDHQVSKEIGDTGRILVRESGTEPVICVMVEAGTE